MSLGGWIRSVTSLLFGAAPAAPSPNSIYSDGTDLFYVDALGVVSPVSMGASGGLNFVGNWNADTNSPALASSGVGGVQGDFYIVSVAGTTLIDGVSDWQIGDWIVNTGSAWVKVDNTDLVTSVNTLTGAVTIDLGNIGSGTLAELNTAITDANLTPARDNYVLVQAVSDLPAAAAGVITLANDTVYDVNGFFDLGTDRLLMGSNTAVLSFERTVQQCGFRTASTTGPTLTTGGSGDQMIQNIRLNQTFAGQPTLEIATGGSIVVVDGCYITAPNPSDDAIEITGSLTELQIINTRFQTDDTLTCVDFSGSAGSIESVLIAECFMRGEFDTGIDLGATFTADQLVIADNVFNSAFAGVAISGAASSANINDSATVTGNTAAAIMTGLSGITLADTKYFFAGNSFGSTATTPAAHDLGGSAHNADTLANLNSKVSDATLIDTTDSRLSDDRDPNAHDLAGADHNSATLAALNLKISDATLIDTTDSRLSDDRDPNAHDLSGADHNSSTLAALNLKISDATLIDTTDSRLSDDRDPNAHDLAGADHNSATLAALNLKVSDATLIDTTDSRLSDDRDPNAHAIDGADHTLAGATTGHVMTATSSTTFAFQAPAVSGGGMESLGWDAGESSIGSILDYAGTPSAFDNGDGIQYSRIWVKGGVELDRAFVFTEVVASGLNLEIAIYADSAGVPSGNKLASTPLQASVSAGRNLISFSASYTPASDRFVWIGLSNDSGTQIKPVLTKDNLPLETNQYFLRWVASPTMVANKQPEPVPTLDAAVDSKMFLVGFKEA